MRRFVLALAIAGVASWASIGGAQNAQTGKGTAVQNVGAGQDEDFLTKAINAGMKEVKVSELAEKNARNEQVRSFAKDLVKDHTKANKELLDQAKNLRVAVAAGLPQDQKTKVDNLGKLTGADFDREYIRMMVDDHKEAITLFETEARTGKNADLKSFAEKTLPTLRQHLKHAEQTMQTLQQK